MKKTVVLIDGGFLRVQASRAQRKYDVAFIEKFARSCIASDEECLRILYYDCPPYVGRLSLPSGRTMQHGKHGNDQWMHDLASLDLFAVRKGVLKFKGFVPKKTWSRSATTAVKTLTDADYKPSFEQKGVDMRIGLDIAAYSTGHLADRLILITNDTDCVPAMKFARKEGLQTVIIQLPNRTCTPEIVAHSDFKRPIKWP